MPTRINQPEGAGAMALTKLTRNGQVTLPADARRKLRLKEGDYLEAEVVGDGVVLRPVSVVDREAAWQQVSGAMSSVEYVGPEPEPLEDETMEMVVDEIHAMRRENDDKSRSR
jgi:AbrB family looped-hinge helix DNA binding protein